MRYFLVSLCMLLVLSLFPVEALANTTPVAALSEVETMLYGEAQSGSLVDRIDKVERDIYGETQSGAVLTRIDRVSNYLRSTQAGRSSLRLQLNLAEWGFLASLTDGQPLVKRLNELENDLLGRPQEGPIMKRAEDLMRMIWGTTELDVRTVELKGSTLVRIRLLTEVDSGKSKERDPVRYRVVEDVQVDGRVVIPAGAEGVGHIAEVSSAGRLGRDGRVVIDFGTVPALDGTSIRLQVDETATEKNMSLELAAGASMAGVLLLGPVGLVGGYFIRGKDVQIPVRTEFFVETERTVRTSGFLMRPSRN